MILMSIEIGLDLLIFIEHPGLIDIVLIVIGSRLEFEADDPVLLCPVEFHFFLLFPLVPAA